MAWRNILGLSILMLPLAAGFSALGCWQLQRADEKAALIEDFESGERQNLDDSLDGEERFVRVRATGRFDADKHILLDNRIYQGRAGAHVFTPFTTFNGTTILVNRGWKPIPPDRSTLPVIETPAVPVDISGVLAPPPEHRQRLGEPDILKTDEWPQLVTYLDIEQAATAMNLRLPNRVIWLDAGDSAGFEDREWSPSTMKPEQHKAYAVQWFGLAVAALVIWVILLMRQRGKNV